jgi:hypothetical protein
MFTVRQVKKSDCLTPKMKAVLSFETCVSIYQSARRNILEEFDLQEYLFYTGDRDNDDSGV